MKKESKQSKLGLPQIIHFCVKILTTRQVWDKDRQCSDLDLVIWNLCLFINGQRRDSALKSSLIDTSWLA